MREFVELAFRQAGTTIEWRGAGTEEIGVDAKTGQVRVEVDPRYFRPTEVDLLIGDAGKAKEKLGWQATTGFEDLVAEMVRADLSMIGQ